MKQDDTTAALDTIKAWLGSIGLEGCGIVPLPGDVSVRRYFRIDRDGESSLLAYYPDSVRESCPRFLATTEIFQSAGIPVPRILDFDQEMGLVLQEDLGVTSLFDRGHQSWTELESAFRSALGYRDAMLRMDPKLVDSLNPRLDGAWLDRELQPVFDRLLLADRFFSSESEATKFRRYLSAACRELGAGLFAPCHRDYMARNLMLEGERVVVIDHQDLRLAPWTYDLASLLNDSLFPPADEEHRLLPDLTPEQMRSYHLTALQRTLKAAGTFVTFAARGNPRHLPLVAPTLERALSHLQRLDNGRDWNRILENRWLDLLESQRESFALE